MYLKQVNYFVRNFLLIGILLSLVDWTAAQTAAPTTAAPAEAVQAPACNLPLLQSFGLKGSPTPLSYPMDLCPKMVDSCCQPADQKVIFDMWVTKNISGNIDFMFGTYQKVYDNLFTAVDGLQQAITAFYQQNRKKPSSNCLVFARKLSFFDWPGIRGRTSNALKSMHLFFKQTYQSFYCSICDASLQRFFNATSFEVTYSKGFCREIINNSLQPLLYLHGHLRRYINLVNTFGVSCDVFGAYKEKALDAKDVLPVNLTVIGNLTECKQHRNTHRWFQKCSHVCQQFNYTSHSDFFAPFLNGFLNATVFANKVLADFQNSGKNKLSEVLKLLGQNRKLQQATDPKPADPKPSGASTDPKATTPATDPTKKCPTGICVPDGPLTIFPTIEKAPYLNFNFTAKFADKGMPVDFVSKSVTMIEVSDARITLMSTSAGAAQAQKDKAAAASTASKDAAKKDGTKDKLMTDQSVFEASALSSDSASKKSKKGSAFLPSSVLGWVGLLWLLGSTREF